MADRRLIEAADLELAPSDEALPDLDLRAARLRAEREVIQAALARSHNTLSVAARLLGISRPTLYSLMQAHTIEVDLGKAGDATEEIAAGAGPARASRPVEADDIVDSD
jgi:two-component system NtrC family response regulator